MAAPSAESRKLFLVKERWFTEYVDSKIPDLSEKVVAITGTTSGTVTALH